MGFALFGYKVILDVPLEIMVMDGFNEKIKYINKVIDEIYDAIAANTGRRSSIEELIKASSGTRLVLCVFEDIAILGLVVAMLVACINREQSGEIIFKYGTICLVTALAFDGLRGKYRRALRMLEKIKLREKALFECLEVFKADREALIDGMDIMLKRFVAPGDLEEEKKGGGIVYAVVLLLITGFWAKYSITVPDLGGKQGQGTSSILAEDMLTVPNEAGKVKNDEENSSTDGKKSISLPGGFSEAAIKGDVKHVDYKWDYNFSNWSQQMDIPVRTYEYYRNKSRSMGGTDYRKYVEDTSDDGFIKDVAENMSRNGAENGYNELQQLELIISFVQGFDYTKDKAEDGSETEYPKYPIETLYDKGGDCEDTCILLASLIRAKGYGVAFIRLEKHMAIGIKGDGSFGSGSYYELDGNKYYYIETTATGWGIGEIPDEYKGMEAEVLVID